MVDDTPTVPRTKKRDGVAAIFGSATRKEKLEEMPVEEVKQMRGVKRESMGDTRFNGREEKKVKVNPLTANQP